ncbi:TetR/AcrR family transcriptional regulator [Niallia nealsonii]|uniref:TetR/AcrR family transcriptional regulator n=1 Tax=Niallia nealsonii TaxID=115979 RepID=A0A2N0Z099_9BACI|nr:TetR/AcrR family transcriptional regulator [Niallia nealsonii]PKG22933.1 TetR/AcrR family transcriptional regulator [Niallia nealsonii]
MNQVYKNIVSTAEQLFLENGLDIVQMQDIADAVGIGIATLFRYFPKKDKLIVAVAVQNLERTLPQLEQIVQSKKSAYERLEDVLNYLLKNQTAQKMNATKFREAFESYASFTKEPLADIEFYIEMQKKIANILIPLMEDGKMDGSFRTDIPIKETIITIINAYGTFGNNIALKSPITYTEEDISPHVQQKALKEILLSYVRPR